MYDLQDAPWIREAELYGMPDSPEPCCPCCYGEPEELAYYEAGTMTEIGCDCCIKGVVIDLSACPEFFPKLAGPQPEEPDPVCPCCGKIPDGTVYYYRKGRAVAGCDRCIDERDVSDTGKNPMFYGG